MELRGPSTLKLCAFLFKQRHACPVFRAVSRRYMIDRSTHGSFNRGCVLIITLHSRSCLYYMSHLPVELEREILELAARTAPDDQVLRCQLMLIARRTRIWCEDLSLLPGEPKA
jgi:hypothetical protein